MNFIFNYHNYKIIKLLVDSSESFSVAITGLPKRHKTTSNNTKRHYSTNRKIPDFLSEIKDFGSIIIVAGVGFKPTTFGMYFNGRGIQ